MLPPAQQAVKGPGGEEEIPLGEEHRRLLWGKGALKTMVDAPTVVQHMVRRWSHTAQQVCYKPTGNQVFIAVLLMEQLVLDRDCPIKEVLYSSSPVPGLTGITLHLAKDFIHCPFIPAIVNHLHLCIFMPKPAINLPATLLMVRNCQVPIIYLFLFWQRRYGKYIYI